MDYSNFNKTITLSEIIKFVDWLEFERSANWLYRVLDEWSAHYGKWAVCFSVKVDYITTEELYDFYCFIVKQVKEDNINTIHFTRKVNLYNSWKSNKK